ncbi:hypothetical protein [Bacillus sp. V5-8f]|nr:hypothetical protein [Bacillus sp. V5-8f]
MNQLPLEIKGSIRKIKSQEGYEGRGLHAENIDPESIGKKIGSGKN